LHIAEDNVPEIAKINRCMCNDNYYLILIQIFNYRRLVKSTKTIPLAPTLALRITSVTGVRCRSDLRWNNWAGVLHASYGGVRNQTGFHPDNRDAVIVVVVVVSNGDESARNLRSAMKCLSICMILKIFPCHVENWSELMKNG